MTEIPTHYHTMHINYLSRLQYTPELEYFARTLKREQCSLRNLSIHYLIELLLSTFTFIMLPGILMGFLGL